MHVDGHIFNSVYVQAKPSCS